MTQPVWVKALHPSISDGDTVFPPRGVLEFPNAIITDDPLEDKIIIEITGGGSVGGDLSGTVTSATVEKIKGTTIGTAGGALVTGKVLRVTGSSSADWGALDLADTDAVTGVLPAGNQAAQTLAGDVSGLASATVVTDITGSGGFIDVASTGAVFRYAELTSAPGILHTACSSNITPQDFTITPQAAFSGALLGNRIPGSLIVQLSDPTAGGTTYPQFLVKQNATEIARFDFTVASTRANLWLLGTLSASKVSGSYLTFGDSATQAAVAVESSNETFINSANYVIVRGGSTGIYLDGTPIRFRDASFVSTIDWALNSAGATSATIAEGATFTLTQTTRASDAAAKNITIATQAANAGASGASRKPGDFIVLFTDPTNGGTTYASHHLVKRGSIVYASAESQYGIITAGETTTNFFAAIGPLLTAGTANAALWLLPGGVAPTTGNPAMYADSTVVWINGRTATYKIQMSVAGSAAFFTWDKNNDVMTSGLNTLRFSASMATPTITQAQQTSGAGVDLLIEAQTSEASGNVAGGYVNVRGGGQNGSGVIGGVRLQVDASATTLFEVGEVLTGSRVAFLLLGANGTSTEMPAGTGDLVLFIGNCSTVPTANAVGGGILFVDSGALWWRGSSGTETMLASADPHCTRCGSDFALQWKNEEYGGRFAVCVRCMTRALCAHGFDASEFMIFSEAA